VNHPEIQEALAAYAIDAVSGDELAEIEEHLRGCRSCRDEIDSCREAAALLGTTEQPPPERVWAEIAASLRSSLEAPAVPVPIPIETGAAGGDRARHGRRAGGRGTSGTSLPTWLVASAAAVIVLAVLTAVSLLALNVSNLNGKVHDLQQALAGKGISNQVVGALSGPHVTVPLAGESPTGAAKAAKVVIVGGGDAYWIGSNLAILPRGHTYQVWALSNGKIISLGVIGVNANGYWAFRVEPPMTQLMVTAEPAGGTPAPTTSVLVSGEIHAA
jgi:anti-sigma-K factor RskA